MHSILAVDDSASMRQIVAFTLKAAGFSVVEAADGQEGLEKARGHPVNLVLTDQNMPRMVERALKIEVADVATSDRDKGPPAR